jgi:flagellar biosynthesis/type III secretory pathway chaperone
MPTTPADARQALLALLVEFNRLLLDEYAALLERNAEAIEACAVRKQQLTAAIEDAASSCDFASREITTDGSARQEWAQIETLLNQCALANRKNGAAVQSSRNLVGALLDIVKGKVPGERLYDARGRAGASNYAAAARDRG